ncbi:type II toxin-antitoxin system RelE/ParE family toxin [Patescibacteria group bacterium]|nr:type II toxin-antitoxin system RelE/ParE family toxin [Patescibacteria group bacterium]MBU1123394.1 type II toxin-antitoxin system RelE/ParE family toxin [Patescibacteria group bacterium]MBU1911446.1 type II toxin-antitoxin system RelE/ParE family toxin [Patescibacteria group bacterium]
MKIHYSKRAQKQLGKLPTSLTKRIVKKMRWYRLQKDPFAFSDHLTKPTYGKYRFRIGDYRVICDVEGKTIHILIVLSVKHRSQAYDGL